MAGYVGAAGARMWMLVSVALAGSVEDRVVPWSEVGFVPAGPERPAVGPDRIAAGADGLVAWWDPVKNRVLVLDALAPSVGFSASLVDDLAFAGRDVLVLEGRTLRRVGARGVTIDSVALPAIAPTHVELEVDGDRVFGVDPFGNRHGLARLDGGLVAWDGDAFGGRAFPTVDKPRDAVAGSARALGGGWVVEERVVAEGPLVVERRAVHGATTVPLEVAERLWVPADDLAVDADGRLVALVPLKDGLHVRRVTP